MTETFSHWIKNNSHSCIAEHADRLLELGASWDTFRSEDTHDILDDLVQIGGIPLLTAKNICKIVRSEIARNEAPMSVFWDMNNVPIPTLMSGRQTAMKIKSTLAPFGSLKQFRGYGGFDETTCSQEKQSDLQLSGCHLIDHPQHRVRDANSSKRAIANKMMIIVDAMQFAFSHPEGATLCFIIKGGEDMFDFSYLFSILHNTSQWRTVVITSSNANGNNLHETQPHMSCDLKMTWESDILSHRPLPALVSPPPGFLPLSFSEQPSSNYEDDQQSSLTTSSLAAATSLQEPRNTDRNEEEAVIIDNRETSNSFADEGVGLKEAELLRSIVAKASTDTGPGTLKSLVGNVLRQMNPVRFPSRCHVQSFLAAAIESKIVVEVGVGGDKKLYFPTTAGYEHSKLSTLRPISLSLVPPPIAINDMPPKALELSRNLPYILFMPKSRIPRGISMPEKTFIQTCGRWIILMFHKLSISQKVVANYPWLYEGVLVDWRNRENIKNPVIDLGRIGNLKPLNDTEKAKVSERVVSMLRELAENDDISVPRGILRKMLMSRWPDDCVSRDKAAQWVEAAIDGGFIQESKHPSTKAKVVFISDNRNLALTPYDQIHLNTTVEMNFVREMLWENSNPNKVMTRAEVIKAIELNFSTMRSPIMRTKMFLNAADQGLFYIAKGPLGQFVGLTKEDANATAIGEKSKKDTTSSPGGEKPCIYIDESKNMMGEQVRGFESVVSTKEDELSVASKNDDYNLSVDDIDKN